MYATSGAPARARISMTSPFRPVVLTYREISALSDFAVANDVQYLTVSRDDTGVAWVSADFLQPHRLSPLEDVTA